MDNDIKNMDLLDEAYDLSVSGEHFYVGEEQKKQNAMRKITVMMIIVVFKDLPLVEVESNSNSRPSQDGFEYLRRVRTLLF
ncbi:hypothetical protein U1Q18_014250 [Sarracenia purpurea var. burkii]